jgi:hypothetical protein
VSTVYAEAIAELERNRGQLQGQLDRIDIALSSLRDLDAPKPQRQPDAQPVRRGAARKAVAADDMDARIIEFVNKQRGVRLSAVAELLNCDPGPLRYRMKQLVAAGKMATHGVTAAARYWPAGTTAKEALQ